MGTRTIRGRKGGTVSAATERVFLLDALPRAEEMLDAEELERAREELMAPVAELREGPWEPPGDWLPDPRQLGYLVMGGLLAREVSVGDTTAAELLGPGDLLRPADYEGEAAPVPFSASWTVLSRARLALLDPDVTMAVSRWPPVVVAIVRTAVRRSHSLAHNLALSHLRRVDARLLVLLWDLADRFGRVRPEGVIVPFRLTHETLGRVVGAQRPSVTTALGELESSGRISRRSQGGWVLHGAPPEELRQPTARSPADVR
jgi:CRP-like cAMP-binding protein